MENKETNPFADMKLHKATLPTEERVEPFYGKQAVLDYVYRDRENRLTIPFRFGENYEDPNQRQRGIDNMNA